MRRDSGKLTQLLVFGSILGCMMFIVYSVIVGVIHLIGWIFS